MRFGTPRRSRCVVVAVLLVCALLVFGTDPGSAAGDAVSGATRTGRDETPWPGGRWEPGPAEYGVTIVPNVRVPMDDGVTLNATVGYPTEPSTGARAPGTFPVIVDQTPYRDTIVPYFVQHGYIFVTVNSRGTRTSEGQFGYVSRRDHRDGVATVEWAAHQLDGSNGVVGGYGCSWDGETQLYTAANIGPNSPLKAIIPACAGWDYIRETFLIDGILTGDFPFLKNAAALIGNQPSAQAFFQALVAEIEAGGDAAYNREFWQSRQPIIHAERIVANGFRRCCGPVGTTSSSAVRSSCTRPCRTPTGTATRCSDRCARTSQQRVATRSSSAHGATGRGSTQGSCSSGTTRG